MKNTIKYRPASVCPLAEYTSSPVLFPDSTNRYCGLLKKPSSASSYIYIMLGCNFFKYVRQPHKVIDVHTSSFISSSEISQLILVPHWPLANIQPSSQNLSLKYLSPASGNTVTITPDSIFSATFSAHASAAPDETPTSKPSRLPSPRVYS